MSELTTHSLAALCGAFVALFVVEGDVFALVLATIFGAFWFFYKPRNDE